MPWSTRLSRDQNSSLKYPTSQYLYASRLAALTLSSDPAVPETPSTSKHRGSSPKEHNSSLTWETMRCSLAHSHGVGILASQTASLLLFRCSRRACTKNTLAAWGSTEMKSLSTPTREAIPSPRMKALLHLTGHLESQGGFQGDALAVATAGKFDGCPCLTFRRGGSLPRVASFLFDSNRRGFHAEQLLQVYFFSVARADEPSLWWPHLCEASCKLLSV